VYILPQGKGIETDYVFRSPDECLALDVGQSEIKFLVINGDFLKKIFQVFEILFKTFFFSKNFFINVANTFEKFFFQHY